MTNTSKKVQEIHKFSARKTPMKKAKKYNYYSAQLNKIPLDGEYAPKMQIHSGETDAKTLYMDINEESAPIIIKWLNDNFINL